jgi:hypothetical protein
MPEQTKAVEAVAAPQMIRSAHSIATRAESPFQLLRNTPHTRMMATDSQIPTTAIVRAALRCMGEPRGEEKMLAEALRLEPARTGKQTIGPASLQPPRVASQHLP